ncbi:MAG TPA: PilZ domain-containing protein [Candidatus Gastranaerophilales bacterium]|nr:PilZ domain-containing protein [Candidatus Gastranaerophilales bacterium]
MSDEIENYFTDLATFKIEFLDANNEYHQFNSRIEKVFDDYVLIQSSVSQEIPDNSSVNLIFPKKNGVFIAQCAVMGKESGTQSGIKISFPYETETLERREYVRVPLKIRLGITYYPDENCVEKISYFTVTRNISASGLCYLYSEPIKDFYDLQCKIYIDDGDSNPIIARCDLAHSKKVMLNRQIFYITALKYLSISDKDVTRIVKECFKYQISRKHLEKG